MVGADKRILVVDDNDGCRDLYSLWLEEHNEVWTAEDGTEALDRLDETVDIVLLDREMPGPSGTEVARRIEAGETDPFVVVVSSKEPDFDLVDMPIQDYIQKPVEQADILGIVDRYEAQRQYKEALDEYFALTAKVAALESEYSGRELETNERYLRLQWLVAEKRAEVDEALEEAGSNWSQAFKTCAELEPSLA